MTGWQGKTYIVKKVGGSSGVERSRDIFWYGDLAQRSRTSD